jgi:hypothetical protein
MNEQLETAIVGELAKLRAHHGAEELTRIDEFVRITFGRTELPVLPKYQKPRLFFFPGLQTGGWFDTGRSEWVRRLSERLKEMHVVLRDEYLANVEQQHLMAYESQVPGRFQDLNVEKWGSLYLRYEGRIKEDNCRRCPRSAELMHELEPHLSPGGAYFFSVLGPRASIPAHHDTMNFKLTCHLPLVVPPGCGIRVGDEVRKWSIGEAIYFDDTFEHEVWNESDQPRICLLVDIWHPDLTAVERSAISALAALADSHMDGDFRTPWSPTHASGYED